MFKLYPYGIHTCHPPTYQVQPALDALKEASLPETAEVQSVSLEIFQEILQCFAADVVRYGHH